MHESKTSCPKCDGHISYPNDLSGQDVSCPHCGEPIVLPINKWSKVWIAAGFFGFAIICLAGALISKNHLRIPAMTSQAANESIETSSHSRGQTDSENQPHTEQDSEDFNAMASLCKGYYQAFNKHDANTLQKLTPESFRTILTPDIWKQYFESDTKYEFRQCQYIKVSTELVC
jgi:hypothetical protein